jgi:Peptidase A4 family
MRKILRVEGSDIRVISHAPSPGFDPLTASRAELEENGFPPVPEDPRLREKFAREWNKLKNKIHYIEPKLRIVKRDATSRSRRRPQPEGVMNPSHNWCGAVVLPSAGESFQSVIGSWVVPSVAAPAQVGLFSCGIWVGIDGALTSSTDLFQAGVQLEVGTTSWQAFWQWVPDEDQMLITNFPVAAGDNMLLMICTSCGVQDGRAFLGQRHNRRDGQCGLWPGRGAACAKRHRASR